MRAKALILTHFRKYMDKQSNYNAAELVASDAFGHKIKIAEDLQEIKIQNQAKIEPLSWDWSQWQTEQCSLVEVNV